MKKIRVTMFLLAVSLYAFANDTVTDLVHFSELSFNSALEEEVFTDCFIRDKRGYLGLFLALDSNQARGSLEEIEKQYKMHLEYFQHKKFEKKPPKKKVKELYTYIHQAYFSDYKFISYFHEIFYGGNFNCVTASALYAIFMHDLGIPFIVKETPVHVYIIAYPNEEEIFVETTDPENRVFNYDFRTKNSYIYHLINKDVISEDLVKIQGVDALFTKYFYANEDISIDQLIGIHYMNHAAYLLDNKKAGEAFKQLEKAYMFYPNEKLRFILFTALATAIVNTDYKTLDDFGFLGKLIRYKDFEVTNEHVIEEFLRATDMLLVVEENPGLYTKAYNYLTQSITDTALLNDISFIYNYKTGRYHLSGGDMDTALNSIVRAYSLKPENPDAMSLFIAAVAIQVRGRGDDEMVKILEGYLDEFPGLAENNVFYGLLMESYLLKTTSSVENNIDLALTYLEKFETPYKLNTALPVSNNLIVQAYSKIAVHYFKKNDYPSCKKYLLQGLEFVPNSTELKYRLATLY